MLLRPSRWVWALVGALSLLSGAVDAADGTAADRARQALDDVEAWLAPSPLAAGWKDYLLTDDLRTALAAETPDRILLGEVVSRLSPPDGGLPQRRFVALREALTQVLEELPPANAAELAAGVRAAKARFRPVSEARVARTRGRLLTALHELHRALDRAPADREAGWRKYLLWPELIGELKSEAAPDPQELATVATRMYGDHAGLEMPEIVDSREALRSYVAVLEQQARPDLEGEYGQVLDDLATRLEALPAVPTADEAVALGRLVGWLEAAEQAPGVVAAVRGLYARPNVYARISERLLSAAAERPVDDVGPVREFILGTSIFGTAHTTGRVTLDVAPSPRGGLLHLRMQGVAHSNNVGYNGPVTIYSRGRTSIDAYKPILVTPAGLQGFPASACCRNCSEILDICARLRLIEKIAWKKAGQQKGQADQIASQRAQVRVATKFDAQAASQLAEGQTLFDDRFRLPLLRRGASPEDFAIASTEDNLLVILRKAGEYQASAFTAPPAPRSDLDMSVRLHQSFLGNLSEELIGGQTLTDERLAELMQKLTGEVPEELRITADKDPWSITFSPSQPVAMEVGDGEVTLIVRGRKFSRGEQGIEHSMEIKAVYRVAQEGAGARLTRVGDVQVDYVRLPRQSVAQVAFKTFLRRKFEALFKPEIVTQGLQPKERLQKLGKLDLVQLDAAGGWLALGWRKGPPAAVAPASAAIADPAPEGAQVAVSP